MASGKSAERRNGHGLFESVMKLARHWPWLLLVVPVAVGLLRLRLDVEVMDLLPSNNPVVHGLKLYQQYFTDAHQLVVTLRGPSAEITENAAKKLAETLLPQTNLVTMVVWQQPEELFSSGGGGDEALAAQAAELIGYTWLNQNPEGLSNLVVRLTPTNLVPILTSVREQLATSFSAGALMRTRDPYELLPWKPEQGSQTPSAFQLASPDGTFRLMFIQSRETLSNYRDCRDWLNRVKAAIAGAGLPPEITVHYTGRPAFESEIAADMQRDIAISVVGTAVIIAVLFYIAHRRFLPMIWLLVLLGLILFSTLAFGGLVFGTINVVSVGFAAILLGLAVDYAVVHYQEALAEPEETIPEIRRAIAPSIFWAAVTTISAFLVLNFAGLPGLGQLGSLVAIGVALSALVMLFAFLPPLFRHRMHRRAGPRPSVAAMITAPLEQNLVANVSRGRVMFVSVISAGLAAFAAATLAFGLPALDRTADALRPRNSPSYAAVEEIKSVMSRDRDPLWVITTGNSETDVLQRLRGVSAALELAKSNGWIQSYVLPTPLWPSPQNQQENRTSLRSLVAEEPLLLEAALTNGFSPEALLMTKAILGTWGAALETPGVFWPSNMMSRWVLGNFMTHRGGKYLALGLIYPTTTSIKQVRAETDRWTPLLPSEGVIVSGWPLLGSALVARIQENFWRVILPMVALVSASLWFAFRRAREIVLSIVVMLLSGFCLLAVMRVAGWSWNLLNMMAVPLILGTGVDYSIFTQLALRRHNGDVRLAYISVGRALLLCGGTAVAGFGSLSLSSNAGMASLGQVCAIGIGFNMLISVYLLPIWWRAAAKF